MDSVGSLTHWLSVPIKALVDAQHSATGAYLDFLDQVCFPEGQPRMLDILFDEVMVDGSGECAGYRQAQISAPLVAVLSHPNMRIDSARIHMDLEVTETEKEQTDFGHIPFSEFRMRPVADLPSRRKRDARRAMKFSTVVRSQAAPEGMCRLIDLLADYYQSPRDRGEEGAS